jgi:hypothetical protein
MTWLLILIGICVGLFALHKLGLWIESRGWIYYHKKKASPGTAASAWLEMQSLIEPGKKHVIQVQREEHEEDDGDAEPK